MIDLDPDVAIFTAVVVAAVVIIVGISCVFTWLDGRRWRRSLEQANDMLNNLPVGSARVHHAVHVLPRLRKRRSR